MQQGPEVLGNSAILRYTLPALREFYTAVQEDTRAGSVSNMKIKIRSTLFSSVYERYRLATDAQNTREQPHGTEPWRKRPRGTARGLPRWPRWHSFQKIQPLS